MISHRTFWRLLGITGFLLLGPIGCAPTRTPIKLHPEFAKLQIKSVTLLPVVDRRVDKSYEIDPHKKIRIPAKEVLEEKGYSVSMPSTFAEGKDMEAAEIAEMDINRVALLGSPEAEFLALIYIEDILSTIDFVSARFKIEATASMISKQEKAEIWRDKCIEAIGHTGLFESLLGHALDSYVMVSRCIKNLFKTLPNNPESEG